MYNFPNDIKWQANTMYSVYIYIYINIVGVKGQGAHIYVYIGPRAQSEDVKQREDR